MLQEVSNLQRGTSITKKDITAGVIPVIAGGKSPAYFHNESNRIGSIITVASSGAYAGFVNYWETSVFVSDAFTIKANSKYLLEKYCFYWLKNIQLNLYKLQRGSGVPHVYSKDIGLLKIPVPPLPVQQKIVAILDRFDTLVNDLTIGLPAEIKARRIQYEYYRNQLLSFKEKQLAI